MKAICLILISFFVCIGAFGQTWDGSTTTQTTTTDWNTSTQVTNLGWGSHHGILFNSYRSTSIVDGPLFVNTKHKFSVGPYQSGAGAIMFLGNGGRMDFLISDISTGADTDVNWGLPKLSIGRNGRVGVGTDNPSSLLSVVGDFGVNIETSYSSPVHYYITSNSANNIIGVNARTKYGAWEIPDPAKPSTFVDFSTYNVNNPYYGGIAFFTRAAGASGIGTEKMVILNNGNVGIGTTTPGSFKLAVNGKIWTQEVNVAMTNPGPDYVFEKDYDLITLTELETYITQHKHLPEVPSAKEMEANGLNLKEMNLLLLKKVEELTLHLIEQSKTIQKQNERILSLEKNQTEK